MILGIETSCDETAVALYNGNSRLIMSERIASQVETHAPFGGVVPEIASREHLLALPKLANEVMQEAGLAWSELRAIAVTAGPGLMGALLVGVSFARAAAAVHKTPVLPIHHLEAHLLAPILSDSHANITISANILPYITLLVSGGHTLLIRVAGLGQYSIIGQTVDDAAGECFDKSARLLGLPYPGGPAIAALAAAGDAQRFKLPRPMMRNPTDINFSFSGLKTAVLYQVRKLEKQKEKQSTWQADMAASLQLAVAEVLVAKSLRACKQHNIKHLTLAGGVAANVYLRQHMTNQAKDLGVSVAYPDLKYCTDNAAMIALTAYLHLQNGYKNVGDWDANPRWKLGASNTI
ncbi:MAG: tRNA (adenosine(37)-N6)-threonylcarbamoyltransferase complex transferase subunit TsaD [Mariprofundales bacterium]